MAGAGVRGVAGSADVIVVGAGVQGTSLAFHLARRGADVLVIDRSAPAGGATGRSSGFVRMHYDLEAEARLAWASFPYFRDWAEHVGHGECGFVRTGFVQLVPAALEGNLRANVAAGRAIGIPTAVVGREEVAALMPGIETQDIVAAAYESESGYADPSGAAAGFLAAAASLGARHVHGRRAEAIVLDGDRVGGIATDGGRYVAPVVAIVAGAWSGALARTAGLDLPVQPWRHDTAYFGLPADRRASFPIVIDAINDVYFRPEGRDLILVGLETDSEFGGDPERPLATAPPSVVERMIERLCRRVPWAEAATFRTVHGGQDGMTPDQRAIIGPAGPDGLYVACGFSGTGFKTAPAIGASLAELILDGTARTAEITPFALDRFAAGRPLVGEYPYDMLWR